MRVRCRDALNKHNVLVIDDILLIRIINKNEIKGIYLTPKNNTDFYWYAESEELIKPNNETYIQATYDAEHYGFADFSDVEFNSFEKDKFFEMIKNGKRDDYRKYTNN